MLDFSIDVFDFFVVVHDLLVVVRGFRHDALAFIVVVLALKHVVQDLIVDGLAFGHVVQVLIVDALGFIVVALEAKPTAAPCLSIFALFSFIFFPGQGLIFHPD